MPDFTEYLSGLTFVDESGHSSVQRGLATYFTFFFPQLPSRSRASYPGRYMHLRPTQMFRTLTQVTALALLASTTLCAPQAHAYRKPKLIIDADIFIGCDDAAALALANLFHARGQIELLGVMVNTPSRFGAPTVSAINTYYNHTHIPIGALKPVDNATAAPDYARLLATAFPGYVKDGADAHDAVPLYRELLAGQEDEAVTVVSIGYFENLAGLLNSTGDEFSHLGGYELVEKKVKEMVVMGGQYPSGREYNFYNGACI